MLNRGYNKQQAALINSPITTPVVGVAGAGTGKTTTILARTKRILDELSTGRVLLITFTRAAANDLRDRIHGIVEDPNRVTVGTFHSVIGNIIRSHAVEVGLTENFTIIDETSTRIMFRNIIESNNKYEEITKKIFMREGEKKLLVRHTSEVANLISVMVNTSDPEELMTKDFSEATLYRLQKTSNQLDEYNIEEAINLAHDLFMESIKDGHRTNTVTYDQILFIGYLMVQNGLLKDYSKSLVHTIVDEYQDTNMLQDAFIQAVAGDKLTIVGDIDQSIYEFRGGRPSLITDHAEKSSVYNLSYNYRSYQQILDIANSTIKFNKTGRNIREGLVAMKEQDGDFSGITLNVAANDTQEARDIIERIQFLHKHKNVNYQDMAILIRSRMTLPIISRELASAKIPINDTTRYADFMRSDVVTDILNYFKVFTNPKDVYAFLGIINTPKQGLGVARVAQLEEHAEKHKLGVVEYLLSSYTDDLTPGLKKRVERFINAYQEIIDLNNDTEFKLSDLLDFINDAFGYEKWIKSLKNNNKLSRDLVTLKGIVKEFEDEYYEKRDNATLYDVTNAFIIDMTAHTREESIEGVTLSTMHNAKGLEWGHVFIIGLEEENFPGSMVEDQADLESERRLLYVAITRAKDSVHLYTAQRRVTSNSPLSPSQFVTELGMNPTKYIENL